MPPEERDAASLWDALQAAKEVATFVRGMTFDQYMASALTRRAVERGLTIIGEALNRLSASMRTAHPEISIPAIVGLRNRIIHEYDRIEHGKIFSIATERIPELIAHLTAALPPAPPDLEPEA